MNELSIFQVGGEDSSANTAREAETKKRTIQILVLRPRQIMITTPVMILRKNSRVIKNTIWMENLILVE